MVHEAIYEPDFMAQYCVTDTDLTSEIKRIETNLHNNNFIANGEEQESQVDYRKDAMIPELKSYKVMEPRKKEIVRENKVKMLEQIMNKNFSHGCRSKIREV